MKTLFNNSEYSINFDKDEMIFTNIQNLLSEGISIESIILNSNALTLVGSIQNHKIYTGNSRAKSTVRFLSIDNIFLHEFLLVDYNAHINILDNRFRITLDLFKAINNLNTPPELIYEHIKSLCITFDDKRQEKITIESSFEIDLKEGENND